MAIRFNNPAAIPPRLAVDVPERIPDSILGGYRIGAGWKYRRINGSATWLLFFTVRGMGYFIGKSKAVETAHAGDIHLYPPGVFQEYGAFSRAGWDCHWVHFLPRPTWGPLLSLPVAADMGGLRRTHVASLPMRRRIIAAFEEIHRDTAMIGGTRIELAHNSLERILLLLSEAVAGTSGRESDPRVQGVLETLAGAPSGNITLAGLSRAVGLSPSRLSHLFKRETGMSVISMAILFRLKEATKLLRTGARSMRDVAEAAGFRSLSYFSHCFSVKYGVSPSQYRARFTRVMRRRDGTKVTHAGGRGQNR